MNQSRPSRSTSGDALLEVNLFGHVAATQPALIRSKGRLVNISSVGGRIAMATYGPYAGTKFALEAVRGSLRREIAPFGVQVVVVEPGAGRTEMAGRTTATAHQLVSTMTVEQSQRYGGLVQAITAKTASLTESSLPADAAAKVIAKAVTVPKAHTRYTIGRDAVLLTLLARPARPDTRPRLCQRSASLHSQEEQMSTTTPLRLPVSPRSSPARPAASVPKALTLGAALGREPQL